MRRTGALNLSRAWSVPFGVAGGAFSAMFGTGMVILSLYIAGRLKDKGELRATTGATVVFNSCCRAAFFAATGLFAQPGVLNAALILLPAMLLGLFAGSRLHSVVPANAVVRGIYLIVAIAGLSLLARVLVLQ
jgi:uncharacterized membrane protein YfcA